MPAYEDPLFNIKYDFGGDFMFDFRKLIKQLEYQSHISVSMDLKSHHIFLEMDK